MTIIFAIAFIWLWTYIGLTFRNFICVFVGAAAGYFCFNWGLNFIGQENMPMVKVYGWIFMALAGWMVLVVLATIYEVIEDIRLFFTPDPAIPEVPAYNRVDTKAKRHWGMHVQNKR